MTIYGVGLFGVVGDIYVVPVVGKFWCSYCSQRLWTHVLMNIIEGLFHSPRTLNGHVKKGTASLIRLPGVTTVKWSQIGTALMFLSNLSSLLWIILVIWGTLKDG